MAEQPSRKPAILMGLGFLLAGLALILFGSWMASTAKVADTWPTVQGKVLSADVRSPHKSGSSSQSFHLEVEYEYTVDGKRYTSNRYQLGSGPSHGNHGDVESAKADAEKYPVGSEITVHYHPENPHSAVLQTGVSWGGYVPLILGVPFFTLGLLLLRGPRQSELAVSEESEEATS